SISLLGTPLASSASMFSGRKPRGGPSTRWKKPSPGRSVRPAPPAPEPPPSRHAAIPEWRRYRRLGISRSGITTLDALVPGFAYFAAWYLLGALAFWLIGMETRGRTIEEIDAQMSRGVAPTPRPARVAAEQTRVLSMANG